MKAKVIGLIPGRAYLFFTVQAFKVLKKALMTITVIFVFISSAATQDRNPVQGTDSTIVAALDQVRSDSLLSYIQTLQDFGTRFMMAPNRKEIAQWVMDKFISFGMTEVRLDSFQCYTSVNAPPYCVYDTTTWQYNVEAKITGSVYPSCEIVIMGHYDAFVSDADPMDDTPGADDNASGVATVLECARVIMETGYQAEKTFIFLVTAAEELNLVGGSGSRHYAEEASADGRDLSMVINNDMVAWNDSSWTISLVNDVNSQRISDLAIHVVETYTSLNWIYTSIGTFCDLKYFLYEGYEGIYFMENVANAWSPYYHTVYDLTDYIDTAYHSEITRTNLGCFLLSDLLENDAALLDIARVPEDNCTGQVSPLLTISNYGSDTITSMDIVYSVNEEDSVVVPWTGIMAFRETQQVELTGIQFVMLPENEIKISLKNINGSEDEIPLNNTLDASFGIAEATLTEMTLKIKLDNNPEETTWDIKNSDEEVVFSGGPYSTPNTLVEETFIFDDLGCYTFTAYDAGGDGLQPGFILLFSGTNNLIFSVIEFNTLVQTQFDVGGTIQIVENAQPRDIKVYPNPLHDVGFIEFTLDKSTPVKVSVFNLIGQSVMEPGSKIYPPGSHIISYPAEKLAPGFYMIYFHLGNQVISKKVIRE